ncbi:DUF4198 domain-containing protein [Spirosoma oryzicola]|uniref:DUF4198 domain-containing protein n=1 Tax=Spirosoma oryzicola TaxID=2898794 RepID=UPI001E63A51F|nr:DUF4198 domain-containing protein [Spirosoma oryzicola]UHG94830.1 DUF4198 domain-containing protein [Spirosoma oryzicola]
MNRFFSLVFLFVTFACIDVYSHALWIETNPTGRIGQKQTVKISYAEPGESPEKIQDWYSDVRAFELWLISPSQQKIKLTVTPADNQYTAEFTPESDGVYTLAVGHLAKDLGGNTKYQFNATATVRVGKALTASAAYPNDLNVALTNVAKVYKVGQPVALAGIFNGKPSDKLRVSVHSPSGWNKEIFTNAEGVAEFTPVWPGTYRIEASKSEKETGEQGGKPYQSVWRCATYVFDVAN